jgi:hypothetical protein
LRKSLEEKVLADKGPGFSRELLAFSREFLVDRGPGRRVSVSICAFVLVKQVNFDLPDFSREFLADRGPAFPGEFFFSMRSFRFSSWIAVVLSSLHKHTKSEVMCYSSIRYWY